MFDRYIVKKGDTLSSIARNFNTYEGVIKDVNNIYYDDFVREGAEIIVPKTNKSYFDYYTIVKGDNLYQISKKYNINPELLATMNGLNMSDYIYPGQELIIPKSGYSYYVTVEGDTLSSVAKTFKTSVDKILNDNNVVYLLEGQLLVKEREK